MARKTVLGLNAAADPSNTRWPAGGPHYPRGLNDLLEAGTSIEQLADYLAAKLAERPVEN